MPDFDLMKYLNLFNSESRTIFGADCTAMGRADYLFLDCLLYGHQNIITAVELGTQYGGTALYLGMAMRLRGGTVTTFDIVDHRNPTAIRAWLPEIEFIQDDVLRPNGKVIMRIDNGHTLLLCDNGNKAQEVAMYAPYLQSGSILMVHDWMTEVFPQDLEHCLSGYEPEYLNVAEAMKSHLRAWRKV